jgi:hypothetical protein
MNLLRALGISELNKKEILEVVNVQRRVLQLDPINELERDTSLKAGLIAAASGDSPRIQVSKKQSLKDLERTTGFLSHPETPEIAASRATVAKILKQLQDDPALLRNLKQESFLQAGVDLIEASACPFCDKVWDTEALKQHIETKLKGAKEATALKNRLQSAAAPFVAFLRELESLMTALAQCGDHLSPTVEADAIKSWSPVIRSQYESLSALTDIKVMMSNISDRWLIIPTGVPAEIAEMKKRVEALPDASKEDEARDYLTRCSERLDIYRDARREETLSEKRLNLASTVFSAYNQTSTAALTKIYKDVEKDFSKFYRFINRDDEDTFEGKLTPSLGKLGFDVNFYGRGFFPPGAYHSEGHQDGMGLCLYLALMKHTLGTSFTFAVLDDVLMSVDSGHRREVIGLLKAEFSHTQFIVTTHDPIWLQHMKAEQFITAASSTHFRKWTIDTGPVMWEDQVVWTEIAEKLKADDVPGTSGTLRRFLEYTAAQLADRLRAQLEFHGDAQYELGELMPAVSGAWNDLLARAKESAQSWGKKDELKQLNVRQDKFNKLLARSQVEQWAVNKSIHYNEWVNLRKEDFGPVVEAFKEFLESFRCSNCGTFFYVTPKKGNPEGIRCDCGAGFNLKRRAKTAGAVAP